MSRGTIHRSIRIADDVWIPAKEAADAAGASLSEVIRKALIQYAEDNPPGEPG